MPLTIPQVAPNVDGLTQRTGFNAAITQIYQNMVDQAAVAFTTGGTAPAFTLTPTPALAAYVDGIEFEIKVHANGTLGSNTLNISGLGAKNVKQYAASGSKVPADLRSGMITKARYDGTDVVILNPLTARSDGPTIYYRASAPGNSANITISCDRVTVRDTSGSLLELTSVSLTLNTSTTGANGLDTGTLTASTWYYKFVIYNPTTGTTAALCSLSATSPTLPSGYTHFKRTGAFRTDGTANKYPFSGKWTDSRFEYVLGGANLLDFLTIATGTWGSWTAASVSNVVPPTAPIIGVTLYCYLASNGGACAPNSSYGYTNASTKQPPLAIHNISGTACWFQQTGWIELQTTNLYFQATGSTTGMCIGWIDSL